MPNLKWSYIGLFTLTALAASASDADASIIGIVSVPAEACNISFPGYTTCPFTSQQPTYGGHNVDGIYADLYAYSGTFWAQACERSWSSGSVQCTDWTNTTSTGNVDFSFSGFSAISGASGSPYDYYYTTLYDDGSVTFYGNGFY